MDYTIFKKHYLWILISLYTFILFYLSFYPAYSVSASDFKIRLFSVVYTLVLIAFILIEIYKIQHLTRWLFNKKTIALFILSLVIVYALQKYAETKSMYGSLLNSLFILENENPFMQRNINCWSLVSKRIFTPYFSNFLFFKGDIKLYYFQKLLQVVVVFNIINIVNKNLRSNLARVTIIVAFFTASFFSNLNHWIFYVDVMSYLLFTMLIAYRLPYSIRFFIYIALLLNHELSVFVLPGLSLYIGRRENNIKKELTTVFLIILAYLVNAGIIFGVINNKQSCDIVFEKPYRIILENKWFVLKSLFISLKMLWIIILVQVYLILSKKLSVKEIIPEILIFLGVCFILLFATDVSRLFGFVSIAILITLDNKKIIETIENNLLVKLILFIGILVPSFNNWYVLSGIHMDPIPGINQYLFSIISKLINN